MTSGFVRSLSLLLALSLIASPVLAQAVEETSAPAVEETVVDTVATSTPDMLVETSPVEEPMPAPVETIDPATYVPGELIVKFNDAHIDLADAGDEAEAAAITEDAGLTTAEVIGEQNIALVDTGDTAIEEAIAVLEADPNVEYAEPNYIRTVDALATTSDPLAHLLWAYDNSGQTVSGVVGTPGADINADEAWVLSTGTGVTIAVIDTGVEYTHPDLAANMWDGSNCVDENGGVLGGCQHGFDFAMNDTSPLPFGTSSEAIHGTHVAGVIAAVKGNNVGVIGVAPDARIMALRVGTTTLNTGAIVKALNFARVNGADIINASYSGGGYSQTEYDAIKAFQDAGGLFVAAAANGSKDTDASPAYPASYDLPGIISVAATDQDDVLSDFSNFGAVTVDLAAPGERIVSTIPVAAGSYGYKSGTSMATPMITGTAALIQAYQSHLSAAQVKAAILDSGDALPTLSGKTVSGKRLNAFNALTAVTPAPDTIAPDITLLGDNPMNLTIGDIFTDPGATSTDSTAVITVNGIASTSAATTTLLVYTATDPSGNAASTTRTVNVSAAVVTPPASSGGGGGGGGGGGSSNTTTKTAKKKEEKKKVVKQETPVERTTQKTGQVLGTSAFVFTLDLALGSSGTEVTELQKKLATLGFFTGQTTGYFGPMTQTAVKAFQASKGLPQVGNVGPMTRSALNGSPTATTDTTALKAQIALLQAQLAALIAQLGKK